MAGVGVGALDEVLERLRGSSDRLAQLEEETGAEESRRDALIVEARDLGGSWSRISSAARRSASRCVAIVAGG